jgi:hypothetical protein
VSESERGSLLTSGYSAEHAESAPAIVYDARIEKDMTVGEFPFDVYMEIVRRVEKGEPITVRALSHALLFDDREVVGHIQLLLEKEYLPEGFAA